MRGRWIQDPASGRLIPAGEYVRPTPARSTLPTPQLIRDSSWGEIKNPMTGKMHDSRSGYLREVADRGGRIVGNDDFVSPKPVDRTVASDVKRAYEELGG